MAYVLFTPVGGHDPIASFHDGAVLHICRVYRPEKVYLYLSHEMLERSRLDDRYRVSLQKLQEQLGYTIRELHLIERDELTQVQLFDAFYTDFDQILREIHAQDPESTLLVNLSSGTPAMKSALNVISVLSQYPMQAVQVSTPNQRENPKEDDPHQYDVDLFWDCNQDNEPNFTNRCREVKGEHLLVKIKKESIQRLLHAYNYRAALMLAQDIEAFMPDEAMKMLRAAECRLQLDQSGYAKAMKGVEHKFMPIEMGNQRRVFEYVLGLQIKMQQGNYADFLRGLTPVVMDLFELCLKDRLHITLDEFCRRDYEGSYRVSVNVMMQSEMGQQILKALQNGFQTLEITEGYVGSMTILKIFEDMSSETALLDDLRQMREIETRIRNVAAHEIVSVTSEWIRSKTGMSPENILKLLKRLVISAGIKVKAEYWHSYEDMNAVISSSILGEEHRP